MKPDSTRKYARIQQIVEARRKPLVSILADDLTESQALKLEAELIAAFGTETTGGPLANSVVPVGLGGKKRENLVVPQGVVEKAQIGLEF
ncbi:MAG TPA: GIY-YIG nuclease family protein, partial [Candidatus Binatia bacterium]